MTRIQLGWIIPGGPAQKTERQSFLVDVRRCIELVSGHFDSVWSSDHLQDGSTDRLEAWTLITYLSALYPNMSFGLDVFCQSFRNPALLAKMVATLQYLGNNHPIVGLGAGWKEEEYLSYGYPFPPAARRIEELEETLQIVKALWQEECATFVGKHYKVSNAFCEPKPEHLPTIMIGGSKPHILRLIARHADWWVVAATDIVSYRQQVTECTRACIAEGRDPATLRRIWSGGCVCAPTSSQVQELHTDRSNPNYIFVGTPEQVITQMHPFIELGVDYFLLFSGGFPNTTTLEMLIHNVLPALNS